MSKIINAPTKYIQGANEIANLAKYYKVKGNSSAYILADKFIFDNFKQKIAESFEKENIPYHMEVFGGECSQKEIDRNIEILKTKKCDVLLGIGGGKTLDAAKAIAYYENIPVLIVPTIASTDAPCSALSVVYTPEGEFEKYLFLRSNPDMVIMDTDIIVNAPVRLLVAGIGDALSTYFEAKACVDSNATSIAGGKATKAALAIAELCLNTLFEDGLKAKIAVENKVCSKAVENIIEANTYLSGIGFESGGLAAAHAIHNGLTILEEGHHMYHGEKVAFGTITQMVLENRPLEEINEVVELCKSIGLPTTLEQLGLGSVSKERLYKVAQASTVEGETIHNMPFKVTADDVYAAILVADKLGK
ncbi:glycerol dehydrogenase [Leptotrichia sp. OH3620_COT-345]|uniref:glycerol dehydrogenase n=1 Tax=Leptotrichia sp. OH3620_COT-345 TaxID=2491048 RepID=UPI000F6508F3|nr:glycerol dehydrogenase [Leptotrichia sp. OH3620_COT-345]RRD40701.1 glycerol dehydrogenase [Leptotrichia sp. OH3620_COT-345]